MIDIEAERRRRIKDDSEGLKTATDEEIEQIIRGKIEIAYREIGKPICILPIIRDVRVDLFHFSIADPNSSLYNDDGEEMIAGAERIQEVGLKVMKKFGLDEDNSTQFSAGGPLGGGESGIEITNYPSSIKDLSFQRQITYGSGINCNVKELIEWLVVGKKPFFNVEFKRFFNKQPPTQLSTVSKA